MNTVVMLLAFILCALMTLGFVAILLLFSVGDVLKVLVRQNMYLIEWKQELDQLFDMADYDEGDDEAEEIRGMGL